MFRILIVGLVLAAVGCTKKVSNKLAVYQVGAPAVTQVVKASGTYAIKWVDEAGKNHHAVPVPGVKLKKGDVVGLGVTTDGRLLALAAGKEIGPVTLPAEATHCLWYQKTRRETQLGKNLRAVGVLGADVGQMFLMDGVWQAAGFPGMTYTFTEDRKGNLRLRPMDEIDPLPPRESGFDAGRPRDKENHWMNGR